MRLAFVPCRGSKMNKLLINHINTNINELKEKTSENFIIYIRVSTDKQNSTQNGIRAQQQACADYVHKAQGNIIKTLTEIESGAKTYRPKLIEAIELCKQHSAILIVSKLDRLSRKLSQVCKFTETNNINFIALDVPILSDPITSKLLRHQLASFGEFERDKISQRTKEGLQQVKKRGIKLGSPSPKNGNKISLQVRRLQAFHNAQRVIPYIQKLEKYGYKSLRSIANELNVWNVPLKYTKENTPIYPDERANRLWRANTVKRIINTYEENKWK